jgi:hypothetical protein
MADLPPQPTAPLPDPDPQRYQRILDYLSRIPDSGFPAVALPVSQPAPQVQDAQTSEMTQEPEIPQPPYKFDMWKLPPAPPYPQPKCKPVQSPQYPTAVPSQHLRLDGLNNDVLAIVVDFICEIQEPQEVYEIPKTSFEYRKKGSTLFCLSLVSKRMRAVSVPKLFESVFRYTPTMGDLNRRLRDIEGNPVLPLLPKILPAIK